MSSATLIAAPLAPVAPAPPAVARVRCLCTHCGAHVIGLLGHTLGGSCENCGSYEIHPLASSPIAER